MAFTLNRSKQLYDRACRSIAGGVNSTLRAQEKPVPLYFEYGEGARLYDVDGNEYIDFQIGQGANIFGHAPEGLSRAVSHQATLGTHWAAQSPLEISVAEKLKGMVPSVDLVRFSNAATDCVATAFRLARAHTGRKLILKFEGHYHGWSDEGLVGFGATPEQWGNHDDPSRFHLSQGVINEVLDRFVIGIWNDTEQLRLQLARYKDQIAAVIFEPILCNTGCIEPEADFLDEIRSHCDEEGIIMIADETITGFRIAQGGAQRYYDFYPDLTIFGKGIGGGVPLAALAGKSKFMQKLVDGSVIHGGTLNANPLCLAAGEWCLDSVSRLTEQSYNSVFELGKHLMDGLSSLSGDFDIPLIAQGPGPVFHTRITPAVAEKTSVRNYREYRSMQDASRWGHLRQCLLEEGVRSVERGLWFISFAHTIKDIEDTLFRAQTAFERHRKTWTS